MKSAQLLFVVSSLFAACASISDDPGVVTGPGAREIAMLEDARSTGEGELQAYLDQFPIGLKGKQVVVGNEVQG